MDKQRGMGPLKSMDQLLLAARCAAPDDVFRMINDALMMSQSQLGIRQSSTTLPTVPNSRAYDLSV